MPPGVERQSSFGSVTSNKSAARGAAGSDEDDELDEGTKEDEQKKGDGEGQLLKALFGALYTLAKEKFSDTATVALINVVVDFLLILVIFLHLEYPWAVDPYSVWYKVFFWLEIQRPLAARGEGFYMYIFYILCGLLYLCVFTCIWVAWCFKNDSFPFLWPIKFVRVVASVFFGTFYIASINIFFTTAECVPYDGEWLHHLWHSECFSMPLLANVILALASSIVFAVTNLLLVMADHELKPLSASLLAAPHSMTELKAVVLKTIITAVDILCTPLLKFQCVVFSICTLLNWYWHTAQLPYYTSWMNCLRCSLYAVHAWVSVMLCVLMFTAQATRDPTPTTNGVVIWTWASPEAYEQSHMITMIMFYGMAPAAILGAAVAFARLSYFFRIGLKFRLLSPTMKCRKIYLFSSPTDVEVISRVCRVWDEDHIPDPLALELGENVLKSGVYQFPKSPFARIAYANFLISVKQEMSTGWAQLEAASKMFPNLSFKFSIFTWEQEHKQKSASASSGNNAATDLVSYVEFQKHYKNLTHYHQAALTATRKFWKILQQDQISLVTLAEAFRKIDLMEKLAEKTYKLVLDRYPSSVQLLRAYANFLETVKNDPWGASNYYNRADQVDEENETLANEAGPESDGKPTNGLFDPKSNAVITITAQGIIQSINKMAYQMFGYNRGELEKQNIKVLMPQPFSGQHDQFLANHVTTGKVKILDSVREVLGQHKQKYVFPIKLMVTKASGTGSDSVFMGVLRAVESDEAVIRAWLLPNGTILCVDQNFIDYAGWATKDLLGTQFSKLATDPEMMAGLLKNASTMSEQELVDGALSAEVTLHHKYAEDVPVKLTFDMGGTSDQRLLVVTMVRLASSDALAVFNYSGELQYSNSKLAHMLAYQDPADMEGLTLSKLMGQPFAHLHDRWFKEQEENRTRPTVASCRCGNQPFTLVTKGDNTVTARLHISNTETAENQYYVVKFQKVPRQELNHGRRLRLNIDKEGVIVSLGNSPPGLFKFAVETLLGKNITDVVDIFYQYKKDGGDCNEAMEALILYTDSHRGASWRVGVIPDAGGEEKLIRGESKQLTRKESLKVEALKVVSPLERSRPAIMQVQPVQDPKTAPGGAVYAISLWRPDMITGVIELTHDLRIAKTDIMAALALGRELPDMHMRHLSKVVKLTPGFDFDELLGWKSKSGKPVKKKKQMISGPKKAFLGDHADGQPLNIMLQAALKGGKDRTRCVAMVKCESKVKGDFTLLERLLFSDQGLTLNAGQIAEQEQRMLQGSDRDSRSPSPLPPKTGGIGRSRLSVPAGGNVPPLALKPIPEDKRTSAETAENTARSNGEGALVTARDVELDGLDSARSRGSFNRRGSDDTAHRSTPEPKRLLRKISTMNSEWEDVHHVDPDHVPIPKDAEYDVDGMQIEKDMTVSQSGSFDSDAMADKLMYERKSTLEHLEPEEQDTMKHSIRIVTGWMENRYRMTWRDLEKPVKGLEACEYNSDGERKHPQLAAQKHKFRVHAADSAHHAAGGSDLGGGDGANGDKGSGIMKQQKQRRASDSHASSEHSEKQHSAHEPRPEITDSDFRRGRRLKRLTKLLSGKKATQALHRLNLHIWIVMGALLALHIVIFIISLLFISETKSYVTYVDAAGEVMTATNMVGIYNLAIDGAFRSRGFDLSHLPFFYERMEESINTLEVLHEGLFLGFPGHKMKRHAALKAIWEDDLVTVTEYLDTTPPTMTTVQMTLWDLGTTYIAAARQISFLAQVANASTPSLDGDRFWLFVRENGPNALTAGYLRVLNQFVIEAQAEEKIVIELMIALIVIEVVVIMCGSCIYLFLLLRAVSHSRAALFSVFLFIPAGLLRRLAGRKVKGPPADPSEADAAKPAAEPADDAMRIEDGDNKSFVLDDNKSMMFDAVGGNSTNRRVSIECGSEAAGATVNRLRAGSLAGTYRRKICGKIDVEQNIYNGKKLTHIGRDVYRLSWPFLVIFVLILIPTIICLIAMISFNDTVVSVKLFRRSQAQASRVALYSTEAVLEDPSNATRISGLLASLGTESGFLDTVYSTSLYGGATLDDSDGSKDIATGNLFMKASHAYRLFEDKGCVRTLMEDLSVPFEAPCLNASSPYHQITTHAIDPMMRRLVVESKYLAQDSLASVGPDNSRFEYIWVVARVDLIESLGTMSVTLVSDSNSQFALIDIIQMIFLVAVICVMALFYYFMFRPYMIEAFLEARMVAELLAMLPSDMNVEEMVEASYQLVMKNRIDKSALNIETGGHRGLSFSGFSRYFSMTGRPSGTFARFDADGNEDGIVAPKSMLVHAGSDTNSVAAKLGPGGFLRQFRASDGNGTPESPGSPLLRSAVGPRPDSPSARNGSARFSLDSLKKNNKVAPFGVIPPQFATQPVLHLSPSQEDLFKYNAVMTIPEGYGTGLPPAGAAPSAPPPPAAQSAALGVIPAQFATQPVLKLSPSQEDLFKYNAVMTIPSGYGTGKAPESAARAMIPAQFATQPVLNLSPSQEDLFKYNAVMTIPSSYGKAADGSIVAPIADSHGEAPVNAPLAAAAAASASASNSLRDSVKLTDSGFRLIDNDVFNAFAASSLFADNSAAAATAAASSAAAATTDRPQSGSAKKPLLQKPAAGGSAGEDHVAALLSSMELDEDPTSLYNRLGGQMALESAVEIFYDLVLEDPKLAPFFVGVDMEKQKLHQVAFMTMAFGGANNYTGRSMAEAHAALIRDKGLGVKHFDLVAGHLVAALQQLDVDRSLIEEVVGVVGPLRPIFEAAPPLPSAEAEKSKPLFERLGGAGAITAAVDIFYDRVLKDKELAPFFAGINMEKQKDHQIAFMTMAFDGPNNYTGRSMAEAHAALIRDKGLGVKHFDMVAGHLVATLKQLDVAQPLIDEVVGVVGPLRPIFETAPPATAGAVAEGVAGGEGGDDDVAEVQRQLAELMDFGGGSDEEEEEEVELP